MKNTMINRAVLGLLAALLVMSMAGVQPASATTDEESQDGVTSQPTTIPQPKDDAKKSSKPRDDAKKSPQPKDDARESSKPRDDARKSPQPKEDAKKSPQSREEVKKPSRPHKPGDDVQKRTYGDKPNCETQSVRHGEKKRTRSYHHDTTSNTWKPGEWSPWTSTQEKTRAATKQECTPPKHGPRKPRDDVQKRKYGHKPHKPSDEVEKRVNVNEPNCEVRTVQQDEQERTRTYTLKKSPKEWAPVDQVPARAFASGEHMFDKGKGHGHGHGTWEWVPGEWSEWETTSSETRPATEEECPPPPKDPEKPVTPDEPAVVKDVVASQAVTPAPPSIAPAKAVLPNTGGPGLEPLLLGALSALAGAALLSRRRKV